MKIDFKAVLRDLYGKPLKEDNKEITLGVIVASALLTPFADEQNLSNDEKVARFKLAVSVANGASECSIEDVALMKKLVGKAYAPLIVGRAFEIIESDGAEKQ